MVAAGPFVHTQALVQAGHHKYMEGVFVEGLPPDGPGVPHVTTIRQRATAGDFSFATRDGRHRGAVLGSKLAEKLNVTPGIDSITLMTVDAAQDRSGDRDVRRRRPARFEVTGIFDTGMYEYDNSYVIIALDAAQELAQLGQAVTGLEVKTPTRWDAPDVAQRLQDSLGMPFRLQDWHQQNNSLFNALKLEKLGMGVILLLIVLVAAFNIISTLIMVVADKTKEIGILRAMGMPARSIRRVFFAQGLVIGIVGTSAGLVHRDRRLDPDRREEAHPAGSGRIFHRSPAGLDAAVRRDVDRAARAWRWPRWRRSIRRCRRRGCIRWRRFVTNDRAGGGGPRRRCMKAGTADDHRSRRRQPAGRRAARWSPSWARAAPARARLLHLLGALDQPTRGTIHDRRADAGRPNRRRSVGAAQHVRGVRVPVPSSAARVFGGGERDDAAAHRGLGRPAARAGAPRNCCSRVGLAGRMEHKPAALSGGEQQRTAVARALAIDPAVLLADEPSGNLDHANSERLHDLFVELSRDLEIAMVIATHNRSLAARADRTLLLEDGRLTDIGVREAVP